MKSNPIFWYYVWFASFWAIAIRCILPLYIVVVIISGVVRHCWIQIALTYTRDSTETMYSSISVLISSQW